MNVNFDVGAILSALTIAIILGAYKSIANRIDKVQGKVDNIQEKESKLEAQTGKINTWAEQHDGRDDDRFTAIHDNLNRHIAQNAQWHQEILAEVRRIAGG